MATNGVNSYTVAEFTSGSSCSLVRSKETKETLEYTTSEREKTSCKQLPTCDEKLEPPCIYIADEDTHCRLGHVVTKIFIHMPLEKIDC